MNQGWSTAADKPIAHQRGKLIISLVVFLALLIPTLAVGYYYYKSLETDLTNRVFTQQKTIAGLAASSIKIKLDNLVNIAALLASQKTLASPMAEGRWADAIGAVESLSNNSSFYDPSIDRYLLINTEGNVMTAFPRLRSTTSTPGKDVSLDEWYTYLKNGQGNYFVSDVYQRIAMPKINVVEVVSPVKNGSRIVGFVALQIPINIFSDFGKDVDAGTNGFVYFVDRLGHIISHPKYSSLGPIIDYSGVPSVVKIMNGEEGVEILYNPIERQERVTAYERVRVYGWGVVAQQPVADAFAARDSILKQTSLSIAAVSLLDFCIAFLVFYVLRRLKKHEQAAS